MIVQAGAALVAACVGAGVGPLPASTLAAKEGNRWAEIWKSDRAPSETRSGGALSRLATWTTGTGGVELAELELSGNGEAWRTRLVVARVDPRRARFRLEMASTAGSPSWTIDRAPTDALLAVNAGQFVRTVPWGWVVTDGREQLSASVAPLVSTVTIARSGAVTLTHAVKPDSAGVAWAFQSYPTLLRSGSVPDQLTKAGCGVDVAHRDARLAIGVDPDGRIVIAMTRFDGLGGALDRVPFGLTTPEMAGVVQSLGVRDAVLLDGGISAQLMVRERDGSARRWPGTRAVPLGFVVLPK